MIEELVSRVFATRNAAHLAHWAAEGEGSDARHRALGDFYDGVIESIDKIVEIYQGAFGLIGKVEQRIEEGDIIDLIGAEANWIVENRGEIARGLPPIENLLDELAGLYLKTFYKLRNLR